MLGFTLLVSIVSGVAFGTFPALSSRVDLVNAMKQGARGGTSATKRRMQHGPIVAQVSMSVVLLIGAGLLLASLVRLQRVEPGYRGDHVLSAQAYAALLRRQEPDRVAHCRRHPAARRRARVGHHRRRRTSVRPEPGVQVYQPLSQSAGLAGRFLIRTQSDPLLAAKVLREDVHAIDPDMPVVNVRTLDDLRERYLATPKLTAMLLTIFAGLALLVTMAGLTGVIAASVTQRTQEFGVRMALGASRNRVMTGVIGQGLGLVAIGLALGIAASTALTRVLSAYLFDTQPTDPITFAAVGAAFVIAGVVACAGPAWRATTVDPIVALRTE